MKIYTSSVFYYKYMPGQARYELLNDWERSIINSLVFIHENYHDINPDAIRKTKCKIFISPSSLDFKVTPFEYHHYINQYSDFIDTDGDDLMVSVLNKLNTPLQTYRNQLEIQAYGLRPLPYFGCNEDVQYLKYYVKNYDYITIGGIKARSIENIAWLDRMWENYLTDDLGRPLLKVHGSNINSIDMIKRYPWYSCDTSSWHRNAAFGSIVDPKYGPIKVSNDSTSKHNAGKHITTFSGPEREFILNRIAHFEFDYDLLVNSNESRAVYNLWSLGEINRSINNHSSGLFKSPIQELF